MKNKSLRACKIRNDDEFADWNAINFDNLWLGIGRNGTERVTVTVLDDVTVSVLFCRQLSQLTVEVVRIAWDLVNVENIEIYEG